MFGRTLLVCAFLGWWAAACTRVGAAPLRVGIEPNTSPLSINSDTEPAAGFAVDLLRAVAADQQLDLEFVTKRWAAIHDDFRAGQIDILAACGKNLEREAYILFSVPHVDLHTGVFAHVGHPRPTTTAALATRTIGTVTASLGEAYATRQGWVRQKIYHTLPDALAALNRGECDIVLAARVVATHYIRTLNFTQVVATDLAVPGLDYELHMGVHPSDTALLYRLNKGLAHLRENGTYDRIYEKWIGPLEARHVRLRDVQPYLLGLGALALAILTALVWQRRLLRQLAVNRDELRKREEQLTRVLEGSDDGFWDWDMASGRVERSARWASMLGYTLAELEQSHDLTLRLIHPDDLAAYESFRVQLEGGGTDRFQSEYRMRTKSGEWRWILDRGKTVARARDGTPLRRAGTHTDITERKRTEAALAESQSLFKRSAQLLEQTQAIVHVGGWEVDLRTDRVHWTAETYRIHETTAAQFQPTVENAIRFYAPESRPLITQAVENAILHGTPFDLELALDTARHRRIRVHTTGRVEHADGRAVKIYGTFRDVTDERAAEAERERLRLKMLEAQKLESLGVLAGGIAHDFNNLLTVILANATFARAEGRAEGDERLAHIESAARRAADLCRQMLAYAGHGSFVIENVDAGQLVQDTARLLQVSISKKARLVVTLAPDLPPVEADASQLRQVVMNLVINASEALGEATGEIRLTTRLARPQPAPGAVLHSFDLPAGDCVCLEVADTGQGMTPATLARVFDPFFTTKFAGRGLGLAAVLGIVRSHRGALAVESAPTLGATFRLYLPVSTRPSPAPVPAPTAPARPRTGGTILIAEDEPVVLATADALLRHAGFHTVLAADGHEAVQQFRANPQRFAAVLLDLTMPGLDGAEVLRVIRALNPDVRVLVMSGYGEHDIFARLRGQGEVPVMRKPFTRETLLARLADVIG